MPVDQRRSLLQKVRAFDVFTDDNDPHGRIDPQLRRSITFDNDTAFAQHALLRTMRDMTTWFCDAYASWQKGGIENANGRLRRWLPRHLDIDRTSGQTRRRCRSEL
jgi:IS30 family transposase